MTTATSSASISCSRRAAVFRRICPARRPIARCSTATTLISGRRCIAQSAPLYTNTVSNTAFRGFGGPQGMVGAERVIDEVAFAVGKDPLEIRKKNFYGTSDRNITPYHQTVEDNIIQRIVAELEQSASYARGGAKYRPSMPTAVSSSAASR
jgi:hypothetical protein